jgi:hypothetical protein
MKKFVEAAGLVDSNPPFLTRLTLAAALPAAQSSTKVETVANHDLADILYPLH